MSGDNRHGRSTTRAIRRWVVMASALLASCLAFTAPANAITLFDGMADQHLGESSSWTSPIVGNAGLGPSMNDTFLQTWVGSGRIQYARYIVPWNAATSQQPAACLQGAVDFYNYAIAHGMTPVITLWNRGSRTICTDHSFPDDANDYNSKLSLLISALYNGSSPHTAPPIIDAWNEPNADRAVVTASLAAQFWVKARNLCAGVCTPIAGSFVDSRDSNNGASCSTTIFTAVAKYEQDYVAYFTANGIAKPTHWGFHPYNAGLCKITQTMTDLTTATAGISGRQLWFTEAGAYVCQDSSGANPTLTQQSTAAAYLNGLLSTYSVAHAFYYGLANAGPSAVNSPPGSCGSDRQDTVIYSGDPGDGAYHARPAARTIYGPSAVSATSGSASNITLSSGTLTGSVTPGGVADASYRFEWGTTASYGNSTGTVGVGSGLTATAASAAISGLTAGTTYHYRLVGGNEDSVTAYGGDRTFTTLAPVITAVTPSRGPDWGGTRVTITGANLADTTGVKFGSANGSSVQVISSTRVTVTSPAGTGTVDVRIVTPYGQSAITTADRFTYRGEPLTGDFDGDGRQDGLRLYSSAADVQISGGSGFATMQRWSSTAFHGTVVTTVGDVNGDGKDDLIGVNNSPTDHSTWVMLANSTATSFGAPVQWSSQPFAGTVTTTVGDVNGDGKADLIGVNNSSTDHSTWVMLSSGSSFGTPVQWSSLPFAGTVVTLAGDVDGDGDADLVGVNDSATDHSTWVMLSSGSSFAAPVQWSSTAFSGTEKTLLADVDGDGKVDLVGVNDVPTDHSTWVMLSNGTAFRTPGLWTSQAVPGADGTLVADVTGDGKADALGPDDQGGMNVKASTGTSFAANVNWPAGNAATWVELSGGTSFSARRAWSTTPFRGTVVTLVADVDNDGDDDLVGVNDSSTDHSTWVMKAGGGKFAAPVQWSSTSFSGTVTTQAGDVNGDGKADLIGVNNSSTDHSTWVMLSSGSSFGTPVQWSSLPFAGTVTTRVGDVNHDSRADLIGINYGGGDNSTWVMLSTGTGFSAPALWSSQPFFGSVLTSVADVNGDGRTDTVAVNGSTSYASLANTAGTAFGSVFQMSSVAFQGTLTTTLGDVTGDGKADLVGINRGGDNSTWVMASSGSAFGAPALWLNASAPSSVATLLGDVNGDGKDDLLYVDMS
jgi:IPT/TIG domain/FG-GAP-like repeat